MIFLTKRAFNNPGGEEVFESRKLLREIVKRVKSNYVVSCYWISVNSKLLENLQIHKALKNNILTYINEQIRH